MTSGGEITQLLNQLRNGNREAESRLIERVYDELRRLAANYMRRERPDHTLQPTALVHEAYFKLVRQHDVNWQNRAHFFALAARVMRRILVDHARRHKPKAPLDTPHQALVDKVLSYSRKDPGELLAVDQALSRLAELYPRQSAVVEMRFFGGLSEGEIAEVLGIAVRTVKRDWRFARARLYADLGEDFRAAHGSSTRAV